MTHLTPIHSQHRFHQHHQEDKDLKSEQEDESRLGKGGMRSSEHEGDVILEKSERTAPVKMVGLDAGLGRTPGGVS